jgi:hypothetical protein
MKYKVKNSNISIYLLIESESFLLELNRLLLTIKFNYVSIKV